MAATGEPKIIQGGMGVGVSSWRLANAVSRLGQLGVVSGTALDLIMVRRLQMGDVGGHVGRALKAFPVREMAERFYEKYFSSSGKATDLPFKGKTMPTATPTLETNALMVLSNFVEVFLAKEGHSGAVGINYLEKLQMTTLASIYGAMLAGVGYVLMGAGIPREIPGALDRMAQHESADLKLNVQGVSVGDDYRVRFMPTEIVGAGFSPIGRPKFLAIISSSALALTLAKKANGKVNGFVIEGATAGGHNAPPRGAVQLNERGEPVYGPRDEVDLETIKSLGLPFWLAGSYGSAEGLQRALSLGAAGVQVGTPFALSLESDLSPALKNEILTSVMNGGVDVFTDPLASPTGFPFKVARLEGTLSEAQPYTERPRCCDLGYLRHPYKKTDGKLGYRCSAEPVEAYVAKGGKVEDTVGRKCLCNALLANVGLPQVQKNDYLEQPLVTIGDNVNSVKQFLKPGQLSYTAGDVIRSLLS